ncbi:MAG TPA: Ig-like domain-containing protein [Candidatus Angelobacter sp.]
MQSGVFRNGWVLLLAAALAGCGGGGTPTSKNNSTVAQVTLSPSTVSIVAGQVVQINAAALNPSGVTPVPAPTFTYNSSNTSVATVSSGGLVCGGVWDAFFIVCNGNDSMGNPIGGSATVTASSMGVTSVPVPVAVHPAVNSVIVGPATVPAPSCISIKQTQQFAAHACSAATPHDTTGPCSPNGKEITNLVGTFSWGSTNVGVGSVDANGLATAGAPGLTGIIASLGSVSSAFANFRSCMPVQITLHINGDPAGQPTESATMNVTDTRTIEADMVDELGVTTNSAPVAISNINTEIALAAGTTLTAESSGGGSLVASCIPPTCGVGLNLPVYSNLFSITVNGSSPATFVYATTSFAPPSGTTPTLIPIDTSKTPIVAGTAINLPGTPNSLIFAPGGAKGYMGTSAGIASLDTTANAVTLLDPFVGKALAVSPDGNTVIFSNAANDPGTGTPIEPVGPAQRLVILNVANSNVQSFVLPGAVAAAFTADSFKAFVAVNNGNVYVFSPFETLQTTLTVGGTNTDVTTVAAGPYAYFANSAGLQVMGTCNNVQQPTANNPPVTSLLQLVGATQNANLIVAVNQTGVDIETATLGSLVPPLVLSPANCTPPVTYSDQFIDFAQGPFVARQLLVPTNGLGGSNGSHIVVIPAGMPQLLVAAPGGSAETIPLHTGATEALSGGMTLDGNTAWVGVAGNNTVDQILLTNSPGTADALQIATSFTKSDGTPAPPNIVGVKPK